MKNGINNWPRLAERKKDKYFHIRWIFILAFTFGLLPWLLFSYWPYCQEWMDTWLDKSDQMRTGAVLLMIGCAVFPVLLWMAKNKEI